jgi:excisionase family DNA binding protein
MKEAVHGKYKDKILTLKEAADYLRMGKSTLYEKSNKGIIPCFPPSKGKKLFNIDVLDAWLEGNPVGTVKG